ncbi:MAG: CDP-alcohol phosphatidyltransferase family protein [Acidimicrobiaceae bacterium]|nr:CDP-alcohol phosphatidyltransferase family protein [Acidimicrobiaceae bacterium]MCY4176734.1 CDP-alcohol phosphatidyltransferase family protein [Acidimicrobiaceae bacterium]MCY4279411.1 CDP-alcohol phosphatidyltransferase family protein [Acidimicrobiaceae bacterium]MCY4294105.1 CDP-alcohol phosphatidyltransferase family protein [Acidimicrobiaceae bacterium]
MFDGNWRTAVDRGLTPIGVSLRRTGVTADMVTITGIVMAAGAAAAIATGYLRLGFLLLVLTGIPDALDGAVAKASGTSSLRGAFLDSVSDRLSDALLFGGIAWYLADTEPGHVMMLPVAVMSLAMLVSYQRAKAESLGYEAKGGIMERAERFIVLGFGLLFSEVLIWTLWVMVVLTSVTAVQRFVKVWRQASDSRPEQPRPRHGARRAARARATRSRAAVRVAARRERLRNRPSGP